MSLNLVNIGGEIEGDYDIIETFDDTTTNKDVLKAVFPNIEFDDVFEIPELTCATCFIPGERIYFPTEWLNDYYVYKET